MRIVKSCVKMIETGKKKQSMTGGFPRLTQQIRPLSRSAMQRLIAVAKREQAGDVVIHHATLINVYTNELMEAHIAISGKHIAYVGSERPPCSDDTMIIDGRGYVLSPGYFEPHAHSTQFFNPATFAEKALRLGTTAIVHDNLGLFLRLDEEQFLQALDAFAQFPVKMFWSARLDAQTPNHEVIGRFAPERIRRLLAHPFVLQVGELTDWPRLLAGDEQMVENILLAQSYGKRAEGHFPGASWKTLNAAAAAGVRACHESISGEDVIQRLRLGMYATLRLSPIRPDLPELVKALLAEDIFWSNRLMLTTDGPTPPMFEKGMTDYLLQVAMEAGLEPITAYRLVTLNPATYYGLDGELGGIVPGRLADILFLRDLRQPRPEKVMAEGKMVAESDRLHAELPLPEVIRVSGSQSGSQFDLWPVEESLFRLPVPSIQERVEFPVIQLRDAVITTVHMETFPVRSGQLDWTSEEGLVMASLIDRQGRWACNGLLRGFVRRLDGLAASFAVGGDWLALGQDVRSMAMALRRLQELGGGVVLVEQQEISLEIQLPIYATMSPEPFDVIAKAAVQFDQRLREAGYVHLDPTYTLMFLSATHLPYVRLTRQGVYSVKERQILYPSIILTHEGERDDASRK